MDLKEYKELLRIRVLMDESPAKAKQLTTALINRFEIEKGLKIGCPHGTLGGKEHCMKCSPELKGRD